MSKTGTSTGGIETSKRYRRKQDRRRREEEARWKSLNGPVISYFDPSRVVQQNRPTGSA